MLNKYIYVTNDQTFQCLFNPKPIYSPQYVFFSPQHYLIKIMKWPVTGILLELYLGTIIDLCVTA